MNKSDLIDAVSKTTSMAKREADAAVNALIQTLASEMKAGHRIVVSGFGTFTPTRRAARMARNPQTGAAVAVAASRGVRFTPSPTLKDIVNGRAPLPSSQPLGAPPGAPAKGSKKIVRHVPAPEAATRVAASKAANNRPERPSGARRREHRRDAPRRGKQ